MENQVKVKCGRPAIYYLGAKKGGQTGENSPEPGEKISSDAESSFRAISRVLAQAGERKTQDNKTEGSEENDDSLIRGATESDGWKRH